MQITCQVDQVDTVDADGNVTGYVEKGCGRTFEIPDEVQWDCCTAVDDEGVEVVIERHIAPTCPHCGRGADFRSEVVKPAVPLSVWQSYG